jgi:hypothetical protein
MWGLLVTALISSLPQIIGAVETLFGHKPKSGAEKLNAVQQLVINGLAYAKIVDPKDIGDAEMTLARKVTDAVVEYNNVKGIFKATV